MKVDLTSQEINVLAEAMEIWEKDSTTNAMMTGLMGAMLCPKDQHEKYKSELELDMEKAKVEALSRKNRSILIRAKLLQALNRDSEQIDQPSTKEKLCS